MGSSFARALENAAHASSSGRKSQNHIVNLLILPPASIHSCIVLLSSVPSGHGDIPQTDSMIRGYKYRDRPGFVCYAFSISNCKLPAVPAGKILLGVPLYPPDATAQRQHQRPDHSGGKGNLSFHGIMSPNLLSAIF